MCPERVLLPQRTKAKRAVPWKPPDAIDAGMRMKVLKLLRELVRADGFVRRDQGHEFAARLLQRKVAAVWDALILWKAVIFDARIVEGIDDRFDVLGRAIVHDDVLPVLESLSDDGR